MHEGFALSVHRQHGCYPVHVFSDFSGRNPDGPVAQLVEHRTFNAVVPGSSPGRLTSLNAEHVALPSEPFP